MTRSTRNPLARYGLAVGAVTIAAGLGLALSGWSSKEGASILFVVAALAAAFGSGLWAGLLATALGVAILVAIGPMPESLPTLSFLALAGALASALG